MSDVKMKDEKSVNEEKKAKDQKLSVSKILMDLALKSTKFIKDKDDIYCLMIKKKVRHIYPIKSKEYKKSLTGMYLTKFRLPLKRSIS